MSDLSKRIKEARNKAGVNQEAAAQSLGFSRPTLSAIESGKRKATAEDIKAFSALYDVDVRELLYDNWPIDANTQARLLAYYEKFAELSREKQKKVMDYMEQIATEEP